MPNQRVWTHLLKVSVNSQFVELMIMVVTLQQVLRPLFFMCFIMGLSFYPGNQSKIRWIAHLNILYSLTIWFAYAYILFNTLIYLKQKGFIEFTAIEVIENINFLAAITSVIMSFYHQKKFEIIVKKLAAVDDTLEELGTPKMYQKMHIMSKRIIIGWIVYSLSLNIFDTMWWLQLKKTASWGLFIAHIINYCLHINAFVDLLFIFFLWHLHLELCRIACELNLIFGIQMTFEMMCYFPYLILMFYSCIMLVMKSSGNIQNIYNWFNAILWISIFLMRLYIVNYICENVKVKANEIGKLFHHLTNIHQYVDVRKEIYQFTLQTIHHPLNFTGIGLFHFGNELLRKFCMAIVTYVIIMVQFKISVN